jgi:predicted transcriptional regulator of viral defense system
MFTQKPPHLFANAEVFKKRMIFLEKDRLINIEKVFLDNHGYATTTKLLRAGANSRLILKLIADDKATKIKRGLYRWNLYSPKSEEDLIELATTLPEGVFCLFTALSYYELTTYNPQEFNMAIFRDSHKPLLPDYPPVKVFYFSEKQFNTGISTLQIEGHAVKMYDVEKTICDCVRYRNKIGLDIMQEALKTYMARKNRNLDKLWHYSETLKVKSVIKPYLEALL